MKVQCTVKHIITVTSNIDRRSLKVSKVTQCDEFDRFDTGGGRETEENHGERKPITNRSRLIFYEIFCFF